MVTGHGAGAGRLRKGYSARFRQEGFQEIPSGPKSDGVGVKLWKCSRSFQGTDAEGKLCSRDKLLPQAVSLRSSYPRPQPNHSCL